MGFFSKIGKGLVGAATGFIGSGGNPLGAIAGGVAGFASSGDSAARSGTSSSTSTQAPQLRAWSPEEEQVVNQALAGLGAAGKPMTDAERAAQKQKTYDAIFGNQSQAIQQGLTEANATNYSNAAARGAGSNSATVVREGQNAATASRELGLAANNAELTSEQLVMAQDQERRAAVQSYLQTLNGMWSNRLQSSGIVKTGSGSEQSVVTSPSTFWETAAAGAGAALTDNQSWWNTRNKKPKQADGYKETGPIAASPLGLGGY